MLLSVEPLDDSVQDSLEAVTNSHEEDQDCCVLCEYLDNVRVGKQTKHLSTENHKHCELHGHDNDREHQDVAEV